MPKECLSIYANTRHTIQFNLNRKLERLLVGFKVATAGIVKKCNLETDVRMKGKARTQIRLRQIPNQQLPVSSSTKKISQKARTDPPPASLITSLHHVTHLNAPYCPITLCSQTAG